MTSISGFSNWVPTIIIIVATAIILGILYCVFRFTEKPKSAQELIEEIEND